MRMLLIAGAAASLLTASHAAAQRQSPEDYYRQSDPSTVHDGVMPREESATASSDLSSSRKPPIPIRSYWSKPFRKYDWNRPEPGKNGYFADDYHTAWIGDDGKPLRITDRVYRGRNRLYYCRRWDGGTQLVDARATMLLGESLPAGGSAQLKTIANDALKTAVAHRELRCGGQFAGYSEADIPQDRDPLTEEARRRNLKD